MGRSSRRWTLLLLAPLFFGCGAGEKESSESGSKVDSLEKEDPLLQKEGNEQELIRYPSGEKKMTGKYEDGEREGVWSSWYRDGTLRSECRYKDGKRHGFYQTWFKNGKLRFKGQYHHGKRTGEWKFYDKNGELIRTEKFDHTSE